MRGLGPRGVGSDEGRRAREMGVHWLGLRGVGSEEGRRARGQGVRGLGPRGVGSEEWRRARGPGVTSYNGVYLLCSWSNKGQTTAL